MSNIICDDIAALSTIVSFYNEYNRLRNAHCKYFAVESSNRSPFPKHTAHTGECLINIFETKKSCFFLRNADDSACLLVCVGVLQTIQIETFVYANVEQIHVIIIYYFHHSTLSFVCLIESIHRFRVTYCFPVFLTHFHFTSVVISSSHISIFVITVAIVVVLTTFIDSIQIVLFIYLL